MPRVSKIIEAPRVAYGDENGPGLELSGPVAKLLAGMGVPSKSIRPVARVIHRFPIVIVRVWIAGERGAMWFSPGYTRIVLPRYLVLRARSLWRRWREPVPAARVVRR